MIPTYRQPVIHVEVTNVCNLVCSNCTRFIGHHRKPYMMELSMVEKALKSLYDFARRPIDTIKHQAKTLTVGAVRQVNEKIDNLNKMINI